MGTYMKYLVYASIIFLHSIVGALRTKCLSFENLCDVIGIFVSAFSAVATVYLGIIANAQNKRLIALEKSNADITKSSCVILEPCNTALKQDDQDKFNLLSNESKSYDDSSKYLYLKFYNCGEATLKKIEIDFGQKVFCSYLSLAKGQKKQVRLFIPDNINIYARIKIKYTSCYNVGSYATFKLHQIGNNFTRKYYHYEGLEKC